MNREHTQYYSNCQTINRLIRPKFHSDMSKAEILSAIHADAEQVAELKAWNDRFLKESIYNRAPEDFSLTEKDDLMELADTLFQNGRGLDAGVAYRIHNRLDAYAIVHNDLDLHIRELYYQGLVLNFFRLYARIWASTSRERPFTASFPRARPTLKIRRRFPVKKPARLFFAALATGSMATQLSRAKTIGVGPTR